MTQVNKTKLIQHLQCTHGTWLATMNTSLSLGNCVSKVHQINKQVYYMIKTIYRYPSDEELEEGATRCLTVDQLNTIICRILSLLGDCNC